MCSAFQVRCGATSAAIRSSASPTCSAADGGWCASRLATGRCCGRRQAGHLGFCLREFLAQLLDPVRQHDPRLNHPRQHRGHPPARDVLLHLAEYGPVRVGESQDVRGLVIGSDGGGLSYVAAAEGSIHRTRTASLDDPELARVADDLRHFLELLARSLVRFVATGEPGYL